MRGRAALAGLVAGLLLLTGCTPAGPEAPTGEPAPTPPAVTGDPGPNVQTDWSQLTPYEPFEAVEERWYADYTDRLIPRDDYGTLVPYSVPSSSYQVSWDPEGNEYTHWSYGLADGSGRVVTDPVYDAVYQPSVYDTASGEASYLPFWLLESGGLLPGEDQPRCAVAALDGSWCTGFVYLGQSEGMGIAGSGDGLLLYDLEQDRAVLLGPDGDELLTLGLGGPYEDYWEQVSHAYELMNSLSFREGILIWQHRDESYQPSGVTVYALPGGEPVEMPAVLELYPFSGGLAAAREWGSGLWGYVDQSGAWAIPPEYTSADSFVRGQAMAWDGDRCLILSPGGRVLHDLGECQSVYRSGDYFSVTPAEGEPVWLGPDGKTTPQTVDGARVTWTDGCLTWSTGEELTIQTGGRTVRLDTGMELLRVDDGLLTLYDYHENGQDYVYALMDLSGELLWQSDRCDTLYLLEDPLDPDAPALAAAGSGEQEYEYDVLSREGEVLFHSTCPPQRYGGLIRAADQFSAGLRDGGGNWVLRLSSFGQSLD